MPGIQQFITCWRAWLTSFLQSSPKTQCGKISFPMRMFVDCIAHQPGSRIYLTHLISIMVIGTHTATICKSLVNSIIEYGKIILLWRFVLIIISIISKTGKHCFNIIPWHFPFLLVLFIRSNNRGSYKSRSGDGRTNCSLLKCLIGSINRSLGCLLYFQKICQTLFDSLQFLLLLACQFRRQRNIIRLLFPFPHETPMPQVTIRQSIISRQLLIGGGTKIHFLFRENQTVKKDTPLPLRGNQPISYDLLIFLISLHILKRDPASPPTCCLQTIRKPIRDFSLLIQKLKTNGILLWFLIINPQGNAELLLVSRIQR